MRSLVLALLLATTPALASTTPGTPTPATPTVPQVASPQQPVAPHVAALAEEAKPAPARRDEMREQRRAFSPLAGDFTQFTDGKIAFLRAELKLTPQQEPAFNSFVGILKSYSEGMNAHRETLRDQRRTMEQDNQLNLPTRLGLRIGNMEQDVQALKILQRALAEFYATLSNEQKKQADQLLAHLAR